MRLFKFSANWCNPCRVLAKKLEGFDICELSEIDIEDSANEDLVEKYSVRNIPTLVLVDDDGRALRKWTGLVNVDKLREDIQSMQS